MRVGPVTRDGDLYTVSGELSYPAGSPLGTQSIHLYISTADAAGWSIVDKYRAVATRQQGDRTIEAFTIHLVEPGRIPATLLWNPPGETHWLTIPFDLPIE